MPIEAVSGPALFVRYAYPPNERGYCGPSDTDALLLGRSSEPDAGFVEIAKAFTGAWPYLELIAGCTGIPDPLDRRVVEAYWVGNHLLDQVGTEALGTSMEELFQRSLGGQFSSATAGVETGGLPHHSFHVFCVYPWVGLLDNDRMHAHALNVVDKCRIRAAEVVEIAGNRVVVESHPLTYDGGRLDFGPVVREIATGVVDGPGQIAGLAVGDLVSVHWDWICDRLTESGVRELQRQTEHHLRIVNDRVQTSGARLSAD